MEQHTARNPWVREESQRKSECTELNKVKIKHSKSVGQSHGRAERKFVTVN